MSWPWLPRVDPEFHLAEGSKRLFWGFHAPLVIGTALLFFVPSVREWTGVRPVPMAAFFLAHLVAYGLDIHIPGGLMLRWPRAFASFMTLLNLTVCAGPAAFSGRPATPLWGFYFVYILIAAQAFGPVLGVLMAVAAVPLAIALCWSAFGLAPLEHGLSSAALVASAASISYVFLARLQRERYRARDAFVDSRQRAAAEQERARIARELHSTLGAALTEIALWSDIASASPGAQAEQALHRTSETARQALQDLRASLAGLAGTELSAPALEHLVRRRVTGLCDAAGVALALEVAGDGSVLPPREAYHVVKLLEEASLNAVRHARPRKLALAIRLGRNLEVRVEDDGCGFDPDAAAPGQGLKAIREHASALGAAVRWESASQAGTRLLVFREVAARAG